MRTISILICSSLIVRPDITNGDCYCIYRVNRDVFYCPFYKCAFISGITQKPDRQTLCKVKDAWRVTRRSLEQIRSVKMIFMVWAQKTSYKIFFIRIKSKNKTAEMAEKSLQHREHLFKNILDAESRSFSRCLRQPDLWVCASLKPANHILYLTLPSTAQ